MSITIHMCQMPKTWRAGSSPCRIRFALLTGLVIFVPKFLGLVFAKRVHRERII